MIKKKHSETNLNKKVKTSSGKMGDDEVGG